MRYSVALCDALFFSVFIVFYHREKEYITEHHGGGFAPGACIKITGKTSLARVKMPD
jgi:hypothetical protein